jgi:dTDP-4-dehydrorhamnose reductase
MKKIKRILLTGVTGQLGSELYGLLSKFCEVVAPTRRQFDLSKPDLLRDKIRRCNPDMIINPAAYTNVEGAESEPDLAFAINSLSPMIMAEEAAKLNIPLVHYSTDYVFDGKKKSPYLETDKTNPVNVYGASKLSGEKNIESVLGESLIIRTSWVYSSRGDNFLNNIVKLLKYQDKISVVNDQTGAPISARELAKISLLLLNPSINNNSKIPYGTYNITAGGSTTWFGFARQIQHVLDNIILSNALILPILSKDYKFKAERPIMSLLDNSKIMSKLNITQLDWKNIMKNELQNYNV